MKKFISTFLALLIFTSPVLAKIKAQQIPDVLIEGTVLTLKDKNLHSKTNPLKVQVVTIDGSITELTPFLDKTGKEAKILMPLIPDVVGELAQIIIKISGGSIAASSPAEFARILSKKPSGFQGEAIDANIASSQTSIPATSGIGLILEGPAGPAGPSGAAGAAGAQGANGAPGPAGPIPVAYPGANIVGPVAQAIAFTGNLAGDVTGPMGTTAIANSVVTGKQLNGGYVAAAGVVADGDSIQTAISKLDGNIQANDADNLAIHGLLGTPTSSNTANEIVERDASGDFSAGIITAVGFSGPLTGAVTGDVLGNVTGDLTGQVLTSTQSNITNLPALANVGTATTFAGAVTAPQFNGPLSGAVTGNVTGDLTGQVSTPTQSSITTLPALVSAGTAGITTNFAGPVAAPQGFAGNIAGNLTGTVVTPTQNSIATMTGLTNVGTAGIQTQFQGPVRGNQGFIGNITGDVTGNVNGNVNGNATNASNATNVTGASQPGITSLGGIAQLGSFGNTANFAGSINVAQNANVVGALTAGTLNASGTITASKFVGNLQGNVLTAAQPNITSLAALANVGTSTTFAGQVTATQFNGPLNGNATTATDATNAANVTGASQPAITTLANLANVNTSTTFTGTVTAAGFSGPITGAVTGDVTGNVSGTAAALDGTTGTGTLTYNDGATNFNTVLTATGATNVTLPTSGTLVTNTSPTPIAVAGATKNLSVEGTLIAGINYALNVANLNFFHLTTTAAADLKTLTGGTPGQRLTIVFEGNSVDLVDDNTRSANTINLSGSYAPSIDDTIELIFDGTSWYELMRSNN